MALSIVTYILVIGIILWGSKFAGIKGNIHEDYLSLSATKCVRGLAALCILLHHISQQETFQRANEIQAFLNLGPALVAFFFFCSGYGLMKNLNDKPEYLQNFLSKRVLQGILIPFYVNIVLYSLYYLLIGMSYEPLQWVTNTLGLTLVNGYAWFPIVLTLLYLAFYFIYKHVANRKLCLLLIFLVILGQGIYFCHWGHFAWWAGEENWWLRPDGFATAKWWMQERTTWFFGQWWVNATIGFFVGIVWQSYDEQITNWFKKLYCLKLLLAILSLVVFQLLFVSINRRFGYYTEYLGKGPGIGDKLITYLFQLPQMSAFVTVVAVIMMKLKVNNPILRFFGKYSLDTYLMNLIPIYFFYFLITEHGVPRADSYHLALYIVIVIAVSILLGMFQHWLTGRVKYLLFARKNDQKLTTFYQ